MSAFVLRLHRGTASQGPCRSVRAGSGTVLPGVPARVAARVPAHVFPQATAKELP